MLLESVCVCVWVGVCVCLCWLTKSLFLTATNLRYGLVNIDPSGDRVDPKVLGLLQRHGVSDGSISAEVVIVSRHTEETGANQSVLS